MFDWDEDAYEDWAEFWEDYYPDLDDDENRTANKNAADKDSLSPTSRQKDTGLSAKAPY